MTSNPTALPRVRSVVPSLEFEIGGTTLRLRYNFAALHEAGANPFDGSLTKLLESMSPERAAAFIRAGMTTKDREEWPVEKLIEDLDHMAIASIIAAIGNQMEQAADQLNLPKGEGQNPPAA